MENNFTVVSLLLTVKKFRTLFWCFRYWLWVSKCRLGNAHQHFWQDESLIRYLRYKTITSQNVSFKVQICFISQKSYVSFSRYSSFCIFNQLMRPTWKKFFFRSSGLGKKTQPGDREIIFLSKITVSLFLKIALFICIL